MRKRFVTRFYVAREIDRVTDEYLTTLKPFDMWSRSDEAAMLFDVEDEAYEAAETLGGRVEKCKIEGYSDPEWSECTRVMHPHEERPVYSAIAAE